MLDSSNKNVSEHLMIMRDCGKYKAEAIISRIVQVAFIAYSDE